MFVLYYELAWDGENLGTAEACEECEECEARLYE